MTPDVEMPFLEYQRPAPYAAIDNSSTGHDTFGKQNGKLSVN